MLINKHGAHYEYFDEHNPTNKPIGSFDLFGHKNEPTRPLYLWSFGVIETENRLRGYGQKMLNEIIALADGKPIRLYVQRSNVIALHIYQKVGFRIIGKYMGDEAWVMQHEGAYDERCFEDTNRMEKSLC